MEQPEVWLRGPVAGVPPLLMPVAHALLQVKEEVPRAVAGLTEEQLWAKPGGAASVGFHLRHIAGVIDRLLTYARGQQLDARQKAALAAEREAGKPPATAAALLAGVREAVDRALEQLRSTPAESVLEPRGVGVKQLPSNVLGLLFHAAEHTQRHTGQIVATAKFLRG